MDVTACEALLQRQIDEAGSPRYNTQTENLTVGITKKRIRLIIEEEMANVIAESKLRLIIEEEIRGTLAETLPSWTPDGQEYPETHWRHPAFGGKKIGPKNKWGDRKGSDNERRNREAGRYNVEYDDRQWAGVAATPEGMHPLYPWQVESDEQVAQSIAAAAEERRVAAMHKDWLASDEGRASKLTGTALEDFENAIRLRDRGYGPDYVEPRNDALLPFELKAMKLLEPDMLISAYNALGSTNSKLGSYPDDGRLKSKFRSAIGFIQPSEQDYKYADKGKYSHQFPNGWPAVEEYLENIGDDKGLQAYYDWNKKGGTTVGGRNYKP